MEVKSNAVNNNIAIGTWNVRSMNQGKLEVIKQEMARVNIDILGISKLNLNLLNPPCQALIIIFLLPSSVGAQYATGDQ